MDKPVHLIEFETMLLGRFTVQRPSTMLERSAYLLLSRLQAEGPMSIGQLSHAFGLDNSTMNRQTAVLLGSGLVERFPDPDGGLARKFRITADGGMRLDIERAQRIAGIDGILQDWTPEEVAELARSLRRFNHDIEQRSGQVWPRPDR
ncbi:MarR family winged helix-turn-helix transcriptional regulator [Nocardia sp. XZ_19_231]|uniref:MarR family winged helix-turn-helix transcriptional regulator n=1 Tax=Nocardia sp. XZ_19_231 TaxID=2769252 RepID=UPI001890B60E|nr:MarR family winged helix-turn-helix transcriptional regulator [Nocardia sp. XZ_19_231]